MPENPITFITKNNKFQPEGITERSHKRRITVVDAIDPSLDNHPFCTPLLECGFQVIHETEPQKLLSYLDAATAQCSLPDLIICDLFLNGIDGLDFILEVRQILSLKNFTVPILMSSAIESNPTFEQAVLGTGADDFIVRPVRSSDLLLRVRRLLRGMPGISHERLEIIRLEAQRSNQFNVDTSRKGFNSTRGTKLHPDLTL